MPRARAWLLGCLLLSAGACSAQDLDLMHRASAPQSLGNEVFTFMCQRLAIGELPHDVSGAATRGVCREGRRPPSQVGPRLHALHEARTKVVGAVDKAIDPELQADLADLLQRWLRDPNNRALLTSVNGSVAAALEVLVSTPEALAAIAYRGQQAGYVPPPWQVNLARALAEHPRWPELSDSILRALGTPGQYQDLWHAFLVGMQALLLEKPIAPAASAPLLLREYADLPEAAHLLVARRDGRGMAMATDVAGAPVAPFIDDDGDGLADTDLHGHYVDHQGGRLLLPTPLPTANRASQLPHRRDPLGRALTVAGQPIYQYRRVEHTALAAVMDEVHALLSQEPGAFLQLSRALPELLAEVAQDRDAGGAVLALLREGMAALGTEAGRGALEVLRQLLEQEPEAVAELGDVALQLQRWMDEPAWQGVALNAPATWETELTQLWRDTSAVPGLLERLFAALAEPGVQQLGERMATQMTYRDAVRLPQDGGINLAPVPQVLSLPVDHTLPDSFANQSIMQRSLDLIDNTNGSSWCNRRLPGLAPCQLFRVPNMAVFYVQTIARDPQDPRRSKAVLPSKLPRVAQLSARLEGMAYLTGIDAFTTHPEPAGLNRFLFAPPNLFVRRLVDRPRGRDGQLLQDRHPDTIYAWELGDFYARLQPLLQPYADLDREQLAVDAFSLLHRHYGSAGTNIRQFEPLAARLLGPEGHLLGSLARLLQALQRTQIAQAGGPQAGPEVLAAWLRELLQPSADGGPAPIARLKAQLLQLATQHGHRPEVQAALQVLRQRLMPTLLELDDRVPTSRWRSRRTAPLLRHLLASLHAELGPPAADARAHADAWAEQWRASASAPWSEGAAALFAGLCTDEGVRRELVDLAIAVPDPAQPRHGRAGCLVAGTQMLESRGHEQGLQPLLNIVAQTLEPSRGAVDRSMQVLQSLHAADIRHAMPRLVRGMVRLPSQRGDPAWQELLNVGVAVNRSEPGTQGQWHRDDVAMWVTWWLHALRDPTLGAKRLQDLLEQVELP